MSGRGVCYTMLVPGVPMIITRLKLTNWRNFPDADVALRERAFIIGPNASGKSNLLDAIRFLRDVAKREGGGLQAAVSRRGGFGRVRCLSARADAAVAIEVHLADAADTPPKWEYRLEFGAAPSAPRRAVVLSETARREGVRVLNRPADGDADDPERLTQTALEQVAQNRPFRSVAEFLGMATYFHLVPQLVRRGAEIGGNRLEDDPFGQGFIERIADTDADTREFRLDKIQAALEKLVPHLEDLKFERDKPNGAPRLKARFDNWSDGDAWQTEDEFSDGTLRLIGFFWSLMDGDGALMLEEPEFSMEQHLIRKLQMLISSLSHPTFAREAGLRRKEERQVFVTTHSFETLDDIGIYGGEVFYITPTNEGSKLNCLLDDPGTRKVLEAWVPPSMVAPFRNSKLYAPKDLHRVL